jgi:hypothetical protein
LLQQQYLASDQIIYYESDIISEIYFLLNGLAGFVIPYHRNVVYIEIEKGDRFGDIDFQASAKQTNKTIDEIFEQLVIENVNLNRYFTI